MLQKPLSLDGERPSINHRMDKVPVTQGVETKLPRVGLDTYVKHLIEMSEVQKSYANVLYGKDLDFSQVDKGLLSSNIMTKIN